MKKILSLLLILSAFAFTARAQIIYSLTPVTNTLTLPILSNFQLTSNTANGYIAAHTLVIANLNTNETYYGTYANGLWGQGTNGLQPAATFSTNFSAANGWTNGATAYITFAPVYPQIASTPYATIQCSNIPGNNWTNQMTWQ